MIRIRVNELEGMLRPILASQHVRDSHTSPLIIDDTPVSTFSDDGDDPAASQQQRYLGLGLER